METVQKRWTNKLVVSNTTDKDSNPTGGTVRGTGITIDWQNGPLGRGLDKKEPTGAFVEDVILAALQRVQFYQASKFSCRENAIVVTKLEEALQWMQARHDNREARQVQGLHVA